MLRPRFQLGVIEEVEGFMGRFPILILIAAVTILPPAAFAAPITFTTILSGANENPPVASLATGFASVVLDSTAHTIQINATFSNLTSNVVAAHIHCCIAPPNNTGVATTVPAFPGFPLGVTSGTYVSAVFDLTQPLIYNPAFVTAQGGLAQAEAVLVSGMQNGLTYFNIHTTNFGGGEIRGQLAQVPEPSVVVLLSSGLLGLMLIRRKLVLNRIGS